MQYFWINLSCVPLSYHAHISNVSGKIHFSTLEWYYLCYLFCQNQTLTHRLYDHFKSKRMHVRKILFNKDIVHVTATSIKGRHYWCRNECQIFWIKFLPIYRPKQPMMYNFQKLDTRIFASHTERHGKPKLARKLYVLQASFLYLYS